MKRPLHPAELLNDFIGKNKLISIKDAADAIDCHERTLEKILDFNEEKEANRGISQEMGWKLSYVFNNPKEFWNNLQASYNLWEEKVKNEIEPNMKFNKDDIDFVKLVVKLNKENEENFHPAEVLNFIIGEGKKYTITESALIMGMPRQTLSDFLQFDKYKEKNIDLSSKMAIKVARAFEMDSDDWLSMQLKYNENHKMPLIKLNKEIKSYVKNIEDKVLNLEYEDKNIANFIEKKKENKKKFNKKL